MSKWVFILKFFEFCFGKKWAIQVEKLAIRIYVYTTPYDFQCLFLFIIQGPMRCPTTPHPPHSLIPSLFILSMASVLVPCPFSANSCLISKWCCFSVVTCAVLTAPSSQLPPTQISMGDGSAMLNPYIPHEENWDKEEKPKWCRHLPFYKEMIFKSNIFFNFVNVDFIFVRESASGGMAGAGAEDLKQALCWHQRADSGLELMRSRPEPKLDA